MTGSAISRRRSAKRGPEAQRLYLWVVGSLVLATTALSLFDTYLLLSLLAE